MLYKGSTRIPNVGIISGGGGTSNPNENLVKQISGTDDGILLDLSNETFTKLVAYAFYYSKWSEIILPDTVASMESYCFYNSRITTFKWPKGLVNLNASNDANWFSNSTLQSIIIPETTYAAKQYSYDALFYSSFLGCTNLQMIDFGVQTSGGNDYVFSNYIFGSSYGGTLDSLTVIKLRRSTLIDFENNTTAATNLKRNLINSDLVIYVPSDLVESYKAHEAWGQFNIAAIS